MSDILLNSDHDIDITNGQLSLTSAANKNAISQHLKQRLKFYLGEWFLDNRDGVPYIQQILKKAPNPVIVDSAFKKAISETPGIISIQEYDIDINNQTRELQLTFKARTIEGDVKFSEILP